MSKKGSKFQGYEVKSASAKDNKVNIKIVYKDANGKEKQGTGVIEYAADGSFVAVVNAGDKTTRKVVDSKGNVRKKTTEDKKTGERVVCDYDKDGTINQKIITNSKDPQYKKTVFYDDKGQASYTIENDGKTTKKTSFEYDKDGNKVGSYKIVTDNATGETKTVSTIFKGDNKTSTTTNTDGSVVTKKSKKDPKTGEYIPTERVKQNKDGSSTRAEYDEKGNIKSKTVYFADGTVASEMSYTEPKKAKDGTSERVATIKDANGQVYYELQTLDANGKIKEKKRYADSAMKELIFTATYEDGKIKNKTYANKEESRSYSDIKQDTEGNRFREVEVTSGDKKYFEEQRLDGNNRLLETLRYDENGNPTAAIKYENGIISLKHNLKTVEGKGVVLESEQIYKNGKIAEKISYDEEGNIVKIEKYDEEGNVTDVLVPEKK